MEYLFSYGTLQDPQVQEYIFGRILSGHDDSLSGFKKQERAVYGRYALVVRTKNEGDMVQGKAYEVTQHDLKKADIYETTAYKREPFQLGSGITAWVYLKNSE
ncbi:gamma-glutamylcyclotransferase family protein [Flagellimonas meishanensis]|uniref:gamma-glutamylcyclotransferase family protein n=1 Tax=Flagellimonas meishanensis TaxID=2873264 RepID=UPI001CA6D21A|nr:gamma-glutamylcyclotransferase family protein [[Muricauda] meishanensis]